MKVSAEARTQGDDAGNISSPENKSVYLYMSLPINVKSMFFSYFT